MKPIHIGIGSDHAGFQYKQQLLETFRQEGYHLTDLGTDSEAPCDYPDIARKMGQAIQAGLIDRGILICGSGVGVSVAANKHAGIRAGVCHDSYSAHQGVEHDDMNVLCMGQRIIGIELAKEIVRPFMRAEFSQEERHVRRLEKVRAIEAEQIRRSG